MRYVIITAILFQFSLPGMAQGHSNQILFNDPDNVSKLSIGSGGYYSTNPISEGIEGTPYPFEWSKARIFVGGRASSRDYYALYDASRDVFKIRESNYVYELDGKKIDSLILENKRFFCLPEGYFEMLYYGRISLLKKYTVTIQRPTYVPALNTGSETSTWKQGVTYFIQVKEELRKISLNKKSISRALEDQDSFLELISKQRLKIYNEMDVIEILRQVN